MYQHGSPSPSGALQHSGRVLGQAPTGFWSGWLGTEHHQQWYQSQAVAWRIVLHYSVLELRMQEMVSMGLGNKPFMDIQPSDAAISDRSVKKGAELRTRASVAVPLCDHAASFKRPHSTISDSSTSSSGSQSSSALGPLSPALLSSTHCPWPADLQACFQEEEELEQEPGSPPSLLTEGTSSSGDSGLGLPELFSEEGPRRGAQVPTLSQHTTML